VPPPTYLTLARHRPQVAQREVLSTLAYALGDTPQLILDEIWPALASLRRLLDSKGGWSCAMQETWWRLFEAILGASP
jgi:hypothetical protein